MSATVGLWAHFRRLVDFSGREDRASFWPYAALVYGIVTVASMLVVVPLMRSMTFSSDPAAPMMPDMSLFVDGMMVTALIGVGLYAAAVGRRLHDGGLRGWWGLMPLPFLFYSMFGMRSFFVSFGSGPRSIDGFFLIFFSNMIYILTLIALIVLLCRRSDPELNRFDRSVG